MAKEYLEREVVVELSNDIIRIIEDLRACGTIDYNAYSELFDILCGFDTIPAADVRPVVRGRWKRVFTAEIEETVCSVCEHTGFKHLNFCPNCGADMRELSNEP